MKHILLLISFLYSVSAMPQTNRVYDSDIATLRVTADYDAMSLPIIRLNSNERIRISFDDLTHTYHRYTYSIHHCNADWTVSDEIFESDYIEGFAEGNTIDDVFESQGTNVQYSHYQLTIPNSDCRLKLSGNYRVTVRDDETGDDVLSACFMVAEPIMGVGMSVTTNTDKGMNTCYQQVGMELSYNGITVTNPSEQIKTVVMQNLSWVDRRINPKPQYIMGHGLKWDHNRDLIFHAGNEYHKFEVLDVTHPTFGVDHIEWDGSNYDVFLFADEPRPNYLYDEDADGAFFIRNSDNIDIDTSTEYVRVNYCMFSPEYVGDIYINGVWTNDSFDEKYRMTYDYADKCYYASIFQKQGYYSFRYLLKNSTSAVPAPSDGSFYQTQNRYHALVYYRGNGDRTDRLVGVGEINFIKK